jgi:hypothetical protein
MPGSSLLSHGETHTTIGATAFHFLSSAWGQVGPPRYRRQANSVNQPATYIAIPSQLIQSLNKLTLRLSLSTKTPWVLYGQASRIN